MKAMPKESAVLEAGAPGEAESEFGAPVEAAPGLMPTRRDWWLLAWLLLIIAEWACAWCLANAA